MIKVRPANILHEVNVVLLSTSLPPEAFGEACRNHLHSDRRFAAVAKQYDPNNVRMNNEFIKFKFKKYMEIRQSFN